MKRMAQLLAVALVVTAPITGVALAASSPTVVTGGAANVTNTTAVLGGRVNPNGNPTGYLFSYGPTTAYGTNTPAHGVGSGTKGVNVTQTITGLTPGTVYHYLISALNGSGSSTGTDRTFTTTGHPPAAVVTGSAVSVGKSQATPTGTVDPKGAATTWVVQYGLTTGYGLQTFPQPLAPLSQTLPVSTPLTGLAPATLFHFRIVAYHGSVVSAGLDQTFFTEPFIRPTPNLTTRTTPSRVKRSPFTFTTAGTLHGAGFIPVADRCTGSVAIRYYNGRRQLAFTVAQVGGDCKFSVQATFKRTYGHGATPLRVMISYRGNGYLASVARTDHVTAG